MMARLDPDVLDAICSSLVDKSTALSMSLTCRELRPMAIKRLLSMQPIPLKDAVTIYGLHRFLFADGFAWLRYLRGLSVDIIWVDEPYPAGDIARCVVDILQHATRLVFLELPEPKYMFTGLSCFGDYPEVFEAICELPSLRELVIGGDWFSSADRIVLGICSPLKALSVNAHGLVSPGETFWLTPKRLGELLCNFAATMEELNLPGDNTLYPPGCKDIVIPAMRSVYLGHQSDALWMDTFVHMFPVLNGTFDVGDLYGVDGHTLRADVAEQRRIRALNKQSQETRAWRHLDRAIGDTHTLYMLGLACTVRHLMLDKVCVHRKEQMTDILRDARPTHLKLSLRLAHGLGVFEDLFQSDAVSGVTHLVLLASYDNIEALYSDPGVDMDTVQHIQWDHVLAGLKSSIQHLRISRLRLIIRYEIGEAGRPPTPYSRGFVTSIRALDHEALAAELFDAVSSLQHVVINTNGHFAGVHLGRPAEDVTEGLAPAPAPVRVDRGWFLTSSAWSTVEPDGTPISPPRRMRRLPDWAVDGFVRSEDLAISANDEFLLGVNREWTAGEKADWPYLPE
ncbi:hypothetical protein FKP32DRAFT_216968 [Trametes sanguinea]|nr:hypothetical protein FKP32DRAFT_216968 [Trametes sanguinea]